MSKRKILSILTAISIIVSAAFANVEINEENFPDKNFRTWIERRPYGADGILTVAEIAGITRINVSGKEISDLTGIKYFTELATLDCSNNQITSLDVSEMTNLLGLWCNNNYLTDINVSGLNNLSVFNCGNNLMTGKDKVIGFGGTWDDKIFTFDKQQISIAPVVINLEYETIIYNGEAYKPSVGTIMLGETELAADDDYTIIYTDNTNAGTATVTVKGSNNYGGIAVKNFIITPKALTNEMLAPISQQKYTGKAIKPDITVKDGETTLEKDTDYSVAYLNNTNAGTATVTITGVGNYFGTASASFDIDDGTTAIAGNRKIPANKMLFKSTIVSDKMEIMLNDMREVRFVVYDFTGNAVADGRGREWDLKNKAGRFVANGSYLVVVETTNASGQRERYSAKLGVKR